MRNDVMIFARIGIFVGLRVIDTLFFSLYAHISTWAYFYVSKWKHKYVLIEWNIQCKIIDNIPSVLQQYIIIWQ